MRPLHVQTGMGNALHKSGLAGKEVLATYEVVPMKVQCCVCKKVRVGDGWCSPRGQVACNDHVSHGYCPECAAEAFQKLRREALHASYHRASVA